MRYERGARPHMPHAPCPMPRRATDGANARRLRAGAAVQVSYPRILMELRQIIHSDPNIPGGTPVFVGTRVPVQALLDYLEGGDSIEEFLEDYPGVSRNQAV